MKTAILFVLAAAALLPGTPAANAGPSLDQQMLLLEGRLVTFDFSDKPLVEVLQYLGEVAGVNLVLSPVLREERGDDELRLTLSLTKVSVKSALQVICELKDLGAVYRHGVILITTPKDARGKPVLRMYSIADLTVRIRDFPAPDIMLKPTGAEDFAEVGGKVEEGQEHAFADPDFIAELITNNTGNGTWEDEGVSITANDKVLIVRQYPPVHREIDSLLSLLRAFR